MSKYIVLEEQPEDWQTVLKNWTTKMLLDEWLDVKKEPKYSSMVPAKRVKLGNFDYTTEYKIEKRGPQITKIFLGEKAVRSGYTEIGKLFDDWFNKRGPFVEAQNG